MSGQDLNGRMETMKAFVRKHPLMVAAGAVVLLFIAFNDGGESAPGQMPQQPGGMPVVTADSGGGSGGGFDMERWRDEQRRDDIEQRDRIDSIREVERCYDSSTGETVEVSIHVGC